MEFLSIESISPQAWDESIATCGNPLIYHHASWLRFLEETRPGKMVRFRIEDSGETAGYFAGMLTKKGPLTLLGSPLTGWVTDYLGPVVRNGADIDEIVGALEKTCRRLRVDFLQVGSPVLPPELMRRRGYGVSEMKVFRIPLEADRDRMWRRLDGKCRNRIRKAERKGLEVRPCELDSFVDDYHAQHVDVFARQGLPPKYPIGVVRSLHRNLKARGQILCLRVVHDGRTVATGLFPHDAEHLYSFGIASRGADLSLCPNEILYWTAMCRGAELGLGSFSIGGNYRKPASGGNFKKKFHGEEVSIYRYT